MTPTRSALVERVAQAISDATLDWCGETPEIWDSHRIAAEAALRAVWEAMREPSDGMASAATLRLGTPHRETGYEPMYFGIWRAMLAASPLGEAIRDD